MLRNHREQQLKIQAAASRWANLDMVFCTRTGNYINPNGIWDIFERLLKIAGLEHMKFHALRHNASVILRRLGIDPVVRREMLGHSRLDMTDIVYGHTTSKMHQEAAKEIDRLFGDEEMEE
jgi:integrase